MMPTGSRKNLKKVKRIVVKIGSSVLLEKSGGLSERFFKNLGAQIHRLRKQKKEIVLVSSGAIAAGMHRLGRDKRPASITQKQALAACGQTSLMHHYEKAFGKLKIPVAQILLTREDMENQSRYLNARHTLFECLKMGALPVINENDTVAVEEIKWGDNDNLSALVSHLVKADLLILLTDIDGVYTADPMVHRHAKKLALIENIGAAHKKFASGTKKEVSVGGMLTKLEAAEKAAHFGIPTVIAKGTEKNILLKILAGQQQGTLVKASRKK